MVATLRDDAYGGEHAREREQNYTIINKPWCSTYTFGSKIFVQSITQPSKAGNQVSGRYAQSCCVREQADARGS